MLRLFYLVPKIKDKKMILKILTRFAFVLILMSSALYAVDFPYTEWSLATYEGASASFNDGTVSVVNGGSDFWHVQLTRRNIELQSGKTYELKFFLQGVGNRKVTEIRIGRDGAPYDAFAEFGEVAATINGRVVTKKFKMGSGSVDNARLEFNLGKNAGTVYFSDVSLNCVDCGAGTQMISEIDAAVGMDDILDYVVIADEVNFRPYSMALGNVYGTKLELGADSKIYGNVDASYECTLNERAYMKGNLQYGNPCDEQNNVVAATKKKVSLVKPVVVLPEISAGIENLQVEIDESRMLSPGSYGALYVNTRAKVTLSSGSYVFQSLFTEPDVEFKFDMTSGPITVAVAGNVRFGDRSTFAVEGGSPSEILWNVGGESIDLGTDGRYFGNIIAPKASVRVASRSHLVGSVYANEFILKPQSTISQQPRVDEISHSEEHFGPFFKPGVLRYRSVLPLSMESIEMYVYAQNVKVKINDKESTVVGLPSSTTKVNISVSRDMISGFPAEAFSNNYSFEFVKSNHYRVFWNPQTSCREGCDGSTKATALGDLAKALEIAKTTGREINMAGGTWNVANDFSDGVVPWKVGFELKGNNADVWELKSENDLPLINLGGTSHIKIEGRSPRSFTGLRIANGANVQNGGAVNAENQKVEFKNVIITDSKANENGGALFAAGSLNLENVRFSSNAAMGDGGAVAANSETHMLNVIFTGNLSAKNGGAVELFAGEAYIGNAIFYNNSAARVGGAINNDAAKMDLWNSTFFANGAVVTNAAIGGNANGTIGNSIFWKNGTSSCAPGECADEVVKGYHAMNSSFSKGYSGTNIYVGNPMFIDESRPAGENMFMNYGAGINLSAGSPILDFGINDVDVPTMDILGVSRNLKSIPLGPYAFTVLTGEVVYGRLQRDGSVANVMPAIPIFKEIPDAWFRKYIAQSKLGRVMKVKVPKHSETKVSSAIVEITLLDKDGNRYGNVPSVKVEFFRNGEENGNYVFQTQTLTRGKPVIFSFRESDVKENAYDDATVLCIKDATDKFRLKIIKY